MDKKNKFEETFSFTDYFGLYGKKEENVYLEIKCAALQYSDGKQVYRLSYDPPIIKHSSKDDNNSDSYIEGDIVVKNAMTEKMIEFLFMADENLKKFSGLRPPEDYRVEIIHCLHILWD
tara:strand:- start:427 stop:783 length:357 start_codon:yes stop_codon:yes gene_type:complete